jgi:hypothetical protein
MLIYQYDSDNFTIKILNIKYYKNHLLLSHKEMMGCTSSALLINPMPLWRYKTNDDKDYYVTTVPLENVNSKRIRIIKTIQ